jgi:serine/threonine protein kinase
VKKPIPFGKYYLLERVNVGGMAEVFKAKAFGVEGFERLLAVKRILPNIAEDEEFITMFIDEAKIAVQLNHANIAQIFDLGKVDDSYFIALEYIHGKDLRSIFDRCRASGENMPIAQACFIIMKVCEGLDYAHNKRDSAGRELGLVHRDVSPQNVLLSYEGEVKLIDFGIAKAAGKASKTQAGILKGKFGYMSPEQVRGMPLTRVSDIFSVGIVLYELLTGERLFIGESDFSTLEKVRNVEILPPSTYNRKIPEELERIVLKTLAKDPEDRYQHAIDLHDELQAFMYTAGEFYSRKDLAAWMKRTFSREITEESKKLEEYRTLQPPAPPSQPDVPPVPSMEAEPGYGAAANVSPAAEADLDWDDDEIETQLYDRVEHDDPYGAPQPATPPAPAGPGPGLPPPARRADASPKSTLMGVGAVDLPPPGGAPPPPGGPAPAGEPIDDPFAQPPAGPPQAEPFDAAPATPAPMGAPQGMAATPAPAAAAAADLAPRKKSGGAGKAILIGLALLVVLGAAGGGVWFFVLREEPEGRLKVKVRPEGATVQIDEEKTRHPTPLAIKLAPGPHMLTIRKPGYETLVKEVEIKSGLDKELELSLKRSVVAEGRFDLITKPPRAEVELDGKVLDQKTDIRVKVPAGTHTLRVSKPGYYPWPLEGTHKLEIKPGENPKLERVLIPRRLQLVLSASNVKRGQAEFSVYKDGAKILSGKVPKTVAIKKVDPKASYRVVIKARGYPAWSKKLAFEGSDEISAHAPFTGKSSAVATRPTPTPPVMRRRVVVRRPVMRPVTRRPPMRRVVVRRPPMRRRPAAGIGYLRIGTKPWTKVYIDGRHYGTTPLLKLKLSAGRHRVVLLNNNEGIRKTVYITIRKGATTTVIRDLRK